MRKWSILSLGLLITCAANAGAQETVLPTITDIEPLEVDGSTPEVQTVAYLEALTNSGSQNWCGECGTNCDKGCCGESCGNGCGGVCSFGGGCSKGCALGGLLGNLNLKGDHCFDDFVEPVTNPVFFEDPRSRTRLRFLFLNQQLPDASPIGGGDFQVYALQATIALNERLSIIAQKDGFITAQLDAFPNDQGWGDLGTGLKYVLVRDVENQFLLSTGVMFEWSNGSAEVFQGNGDGMWNFFLTTGKAFGECKQNHFIGTVGWHLPEDRRAEVESLFYSLHLDRHIGNGLYGLIELNGIQYVSNGTRFPGLNVEGGDLINLGAGAVDGNHFVSFAFGASKKIGSNIELGTAWEFPITGREDLMKNRLTTTLSWTY